MIKRWKDRQLTGFYPFPYVTPLCFIWRSLSSYHHLFLLSLPFLQTCSPNMNFPLAFARLLTLQTMQSTKREERDIKKRPNATSGMGRWGRDWGSYSLLSVSFSFTFSCHVCRWQQLTLSLGLISITVSPRTSPTLNAKKRSTDSVPDGEASHHINSITPRPSSLWPG